MKQVFLFTGLAFLAGCALGYTGQVGNDRDTHGCIGSAGYVWSVVHNQCIRPWETGLQLPEVTTNSSYQSRASGVFSADFSQVELFLPGESSSLTLERSGDEWKAALATWRLVRYPSQAGRQERWELWEGSTLRFQAAPVLMQPLYETKPN